jgi:two-component system, NtrC family, response regulator HydG
LGENVSQIRILLVGGDAAELRLAAAMARELGAEVELARSFDHAFDSLRRNGSDLVLIEVTLDVAAFIAQLRTERIAVPVLGCGVDASAARAVAAVRAGAYDYVPLPPQKELIAAVLLSIGERRHRLVGDDPALRRAVDYASAFASSSVPMLFLGESGTGKELLARHVHARSGRKGRFVVAECVGVAADVLESELFGHAAGAFEGAVAARAGRLAEAADGTLLIRNIDALPPIAQARLLGAMAELSPGGARLMATTSVNLAARASEGGFRADLLARIGLVQVEMPALRQRGPDIVRLADMFAVQLAAANGLPPRRFTAEALDLLRGHGWPGNVRELENLVHRAVLLAPEEAIGPEHIVRDDGSPIAAAPPGSDAELQIEGLVGHSVADVERELILQTLERCGGNRTSASTILGISVRTMRNKLRSFIDAGYPVSPAL